MRGGRKPTETNLNDMKAPAAVGQSPLTPPQVRAMYPGALWCRIERMQALCSEWTGARASAVP